MSTWARNQQSWWPFGKREDRSKGLAVRFDERANVTWTADPQTGKPQRSISPALLRTEVETCGFCHARRRRILRGLDARATGCPIHIGCHHLSADSFMPTVRHATSRSHTTISPSSRARCSRRASPAAIATSRTAPRYVRPATASACNVTPSTNSILPPTAIMSDVKPALACTSCHMQTRTYMVVDPRHDHSFRVPRPDLSAKIGTPNACNNCHRDQSPQWAAAAIERWHGPNRIGFQNYAEAFHAAWTEQPDAERLLAAVASNGSTPAYVRAGALAELNAFVSPANLDLARKGLADPDPMVRLGSLDMLEGIQVEGLWPLLSPLLSDSVRGVRIRAVSLLATVPTPRQPPADRDRFDRAAAEFIAAQRLNADRPEARTALGAFFVRRGNTTEAEKEFTAALRLSPQFAPAAINLADLDRQQGRDGDGVKVLQETIVSAPQDAGLHHALGLALVRLKRNDEALAELNKASELDPERARYAYVYAVALQSGGRTQDAMTVLKGNLARHPNDRDTLLALISFSRDSGDAKAALDYAQRLAQISPADPGLTALIDALKRQIESSPR